MFKIGDYVVYRKDVCVIKKINKNYYRGKDYYRLELVNDDSLKVDVPIDSEFIRNLISRSRLDQIIDSIPNIDIIDNNDKYIDNTYKELMLRGNHEDLIKVIKTTYLRNKERLDNKKKVTDKDSSYFEMAERYLYTEFSIVLGVSFEDAKSYVIKKVEELCQ